MEAARFELLARLFDSALALEGSARASFIHEHCREDPSLRTELERLLAAHEAEQGDAALLERGPPSPEAPLLVAQAPIDGPPTVGRYRILRPIASGGMGTVYLAEQEDPRRCVAIKLLHPGLAGTSMLRRFQQEAQLLARLNHPSIAHVYEVGSVGTGPRTQPFIAMEFVDGVPLTEYARRNQLDVRQRLLLLAEVADGLEHAHERGVVHRDLKPANILVDADGRPRILDLGVARAIGDDTRLATMQTETGQLIGTMPYMSPEQAGGHVNEVDARADIYALGVVAFELLVGRLPYLLDGRGLHEVLRIIREEEPTRLSAIDRSLSGDVETVVLHSLEKEPARRYQSAAEFAADLRAAARNEEIRARPASRIHRMRTFVRRNRALVAGTLAVFAVLVAGMVATSLALARALDAEALAEARLERVSREAAKVREVNRFVLEMLAAVDPRTARDPDVRMREVLDAAAARLDAGDGPAVPEIAAAIRHTIASTYRALGAHEPARRFAEEALRIRREVLGDSHLETIESMMELSEIHRESGDLAAAEPLAEEALERLRADAEAPRASVAVGVNNLALIRRAQGRGDEAKRLNEEALELRRGLHEGAHNDIVTSLNNLALVVHLHDRDPSAAEALLREAVEMLRSMHPQGHVHLAASLDNLASVVAAQGRLEDAEQLSRESVEMRRRLLPPEHDMLGEGLSNLGFILRRQGRLAEAEPFYRESLAIRRAVWPGDHPGVATSLNNYGQLLRASGRLQEAEPLLREALEMRRRLFPGDHPIVAATAHVLGFLLMQMDRLDEAIGLLREALEMTRRIPGDQRDDEATIATNLAEALRRRGSLAEAAPLLARALELRQALAGPDHASIAQALIALARVQIEAGGSDGGSEGREGAERLLNEATAMLERIPASPESLRTELEALRAQVRGP